MEYENKPLAPQAIPMKGVFSGQVVDQKTQQPIANATVKLYSAYSSSQSNAQHLLAALKTNETGYYNTINITTNAVYVLAASEGYYESPYPQCSNAEKVQNETYFIHPIQLIKQSVQPPTIIAELYIENSKSTPILFHGASEGNVIRISKSSMLSGSFRNEFGTNSITAHLTYRLINQEANTVAGSPYLRHHLTATVTSSYEVFVPNKTLIYTNVPPIETNYFTATEMTATTQPTWNGDANFTLLFDATLYLNGDGASYAQAYHTTFKIIISP